MADRGVDIRLGERDAAAITADGVSACAAARWLTLVRGARLLACQLDAAEDLVQSTLVKLLRASAASNPTGQHD